MEKEFIRLNTTLKPPQEVLEKAIVLSQEIAKTHEPVFVLDEVDFHPHITVYSPEYPKHNKEKVLSIVEEVVVKNSALSCKFKSVDALQGFITIQIEISDAIKQLHEQLVGKLNPLREGHLRNKYLPESDYFVKFSQEQKESIAKYGYSDAMDLYDPHLTIIRLKNHQEAEVVAGQVDWGIDEFIADTIAVYTMGNNGTCKKLIKEFGLQH